MALTKITSTNIQPGAIESSSLETSGATAGTYGAAAKIPVLSVNAQGIVFAISEADVAGVTDFTYNSSTEVLTISTADGSTFNADISTLASQTYVDTAESDAVTTANAYTDTRESAITTAYENYTDTAVSNLVDTAPAALDTLNELAAALGDDANFATTVSTNLGNKVDKINITGATVGTSTAIPVITFNAQGQITSASTTPITVGDGTLTVNSGTGLSGSGTFTANQTSNGTITLSHADTSSQASVNNSGANVIQDVTLDGFGHVTGLGSVDLSTQFLGINAKAADSDLLDGLNSTQFLRSDANGTLAGSLTLQSVLSNRDSNSAYVKFVQAGTANDTNGDVDIAGYYPIIFRTDMEYERMRINRNGNVGIGTASPGYKVQVDHGTTSQYVSSIRNTADNLQLLLGTTTGGLLNIQGKTISTNTAYQIALQAEGGNVGIGTTSPAYPLDVRSGVAGDQLFLDSTGNQNAIRFAQNGTVKSQFGMSIASGRIINNSDPYDTNLKVFGGNFRVGDGAGVEKFRVDVDDDYVMIPSTTFANLDANAPAGSIAYVSDDNGNLAYRTSGGWSIFTAAVGSSANPAESVAQILSAGADTGDGIYYFLLNGATVPIYCDFTYDDPTHGRGWMLAGRVFGNNTTFNILSANWTNTSMFGQKTSYTDTDNMKNEAWLYYNHNVTLFQFKSTMSSADLPYTRATHNKATTLNGIFDWDNKANGFITFPEQFETSGSVTTACNNYLDATGYTDGRPGSPYGKLGLNVFMQTGTSSTGTEENWDTVSAGQSARSGCRFGFLGDGSSGGGVWPGQTGGPDDFFVGISGQHCYDSQNCNVISSTQTPGSYRFSSSYNGDTGSFYTRVNLWVK